ncbi:MAG TPA: zf-HC2 domain-containing protein [Humisphaera sp.]|jgi:predicted anti-sigma-YlaC factor YlaD|nr:zf-HC2 domain-containing protein [Humisphaera sp.]
MTCRDVTEFLDRYLDGDLPRRQQLSFRFHLLLCGNCRNYLRSYKMTIRAAKAAMTNSNGPPPAGMPEELVQAILAARRKS